MISRLKKFTLTHLNFVIDLFFNTAILISELIVQIKIHGNVRFETRS